MIVEERTNVYIFAYCLDKKRESERHDNEIPVEPALVSRITEDVSLHLPHDSLGDL